MGQESRLAVILFAFILMACPVQAEEGTAELASALEQAGKALPRNCAKNPDCIAKRKELRRTYVELRRRCLSEPGQDGCAVGARHDFIGAVTGYEAAAEDAALECRVDPSTAGCVAQQKRLSERSKELKRLCALGFEPKVCAEVLTPGPRRRRHYIERAKQ